MPDPRAPLASRLLRRGYHALPVLALLALWTAVLYARALAVGVLSDGWVLLEIGSLGVRKAPFVLLSYHTIPVTNLFMAVLWKLFGLHQLRYQALNLAELTLTGWLLYRVGRAFFGQARVALFAALLFLANSSFYEVPFWPTVGNFQSLAAMLYLAGVLAVIRAFRSPRPWPWIVLFSLCGLAAFFTYEPAVSVLGVGVLYAALVPPGGEPLPLRDRARRTLAVLALSLPAIAVVLGSKLYTSAQGYQAMFLPHDWAGLKFRLYLLLRGCVAIFTLRGSDSRIYRLMSFGVSPPAGSLEQKVLLVTMALGLGIAGALLVWRTRSPAARLAALWFAAHMVTVATATDIVSRHFYLGALPASLLLSWLIWSAADRLAARLSRREGFAALDMTGGQAGAILAGLVLALLVAGAATDLNTAATLHRQASAASRQIADLVGQRLAADPAAPPRVALVNMPAILAQDGIGAFTFVNGLHQFLRLSTHHRVAGLELFYTYASFADGKFANESRPIALGELARRARDPGGLVLMFDGRTRSVVELNRASWRAPERYDLDSAPYLEWQTGAWPWFRAYAGQPLELPLAVSPERSWVAVRYLRAPGAAFTVTDAAGPRLEVRAPAGAKPAWPVATFAVDGTVSPAVLTLHPGSEVWLAGVQSFAPPVDYTPESAPFLSWTFLPFPQFLVEAPAALPLGGCSSPPCTLRVEYLAEKGRDFTLAAGDGPGQSFAFAGVAVPEWRTVRIPAPAAGPAVARIDPKGPTPVLIRRLGWDRPIR